GAAAHPIRPPPNASRSARATTSPGALSARAAHAEYPRRYTELGRSPSPPLEERAGERRDSWRRGRSPASFLTQPQCSSPPAASTSRKPPAPPPQRHTRLPAPAHPVPAIAHTARSPTAHI